MSAGHRSRRSILAVTSEEPWPLDSGGHLRTYHLLRRLAVSHRVTLVVPAGTAEGAAAMTAAGVEVRAVSSGPPGRVAQVVSALEAACRAQPYVMYRRHYHRAVARVLPELQRAVRADVLYLDHLDSFAYADLPDATVVGDLHNVYSTLLARTADEEPHRLRRWYLTREARLLARAEQDAVQRAHLLLAVSDDDRRHFASIGAADVRVVPNGVDCAAYADLPAGRHGAPIVMFLGAMSWAPNVTAVELLAETVLPALRTRIPDARLRIVGRDPSPRVRRLATRPGVEVTGAVPDVRPYLEEARLLAVPLTAGGGTRLKILEAFAAGLPVVSTPVGCEGIAAAADRHLVVADTGTFAEALTAALLEPDRMATLAGEARTLVRARYDWDAVGAAASEAIAHAGRVPDLSAR